MKVDHLLAQDILLREAMRVVVKRVVVKRVVVKSTVQSLSDEILIGVLLFSIKELGALVTVSKRWARLCHKPTVLEAHTVWLRGDEHFKRMLHDVGMVRSPKCSWATTPLRHASKILCADKLIVSTAAKSCTLLNQENKHHIS